jgi:trimeric autotransporter adhesin
MRFRLTHFQLLLFMAWGFFSWVDALNAQTPAWAENFHLPGLNGAVRAVVETPDAFYYGGDFTKVGKLPIKYILRLDKLSGAVTPLEGLVADSGDGVAALAVMGDDLYVGGGIRGIPSGRYGIAVGRIARWNMSSKTWFPLGAEFANGVNGNVLALAAMGTDLYVAGAFTFLSGQNRQAKSVVKWSTAENKWSALGAPGQNGLGVGGTWTVARALAVHGTDLYVGGDFTAVNSATQKALPVDRLARWDTVREVWEPLGSASQNGVQIHSTFREANVRTMAVRGNNLYVGGEFDSVKSSSQSSLTVSSLARWNPTDKTWSAVGSGLVYPADRTFSRVSAMGFSDTHLYVGGWGIWLGNAAAPRLQARSIAKWNIMENTWSLMGGGTAGPDDEVMALLVSEPYLHAGGAFKSVASATQLRLPSLHAAKWHIAKEAWAAVPAEQAGDGIHGTVFAILDAGHEIYVGGYFQAAGQVTANNVACWNKVSRTWSALGSPNQNGTSEAVYALAIAGDELYVGGAFQAVGVGLAAAIPARRLAKWNRTTRRWAALGSSDRNGLGGSVRALLVHGTNLLAGGEFTSVSSSNQALLPAQRVASWSLTDEVWSVLGTEERNGVGSTDYSSVYALAFHQGKLCVGGSFLSASSAGQTDIPVNRIAAWDFDLKRWERLGGGMDKGNQGAGAGVYSLLNTGDFLYAGGDFLEIVTDTTTPLSARCIARWNSALQQWEPLGTESQNGTNAPVRALCQSADGVVVGGEFTSADSGTQTAIPLARAARWRSGDSSWQPLGTPQYNGASEYSAKVFAVGKAGVDTNIGGKFNGVKSTYHFIPSPGFAVFGPSYGEPALQVLWPSTGLELRDGTTTIPFEGVGLEGINRTRSLTLFNPGTADLTDLKIEIDGANAGDFTNGPLPETILRPGDKMTIRFTFSPQTLGPRQASARILSNASGGTNPFDLIFTGTGLSPIGAWRDSHFGTETNTGSAADNADFNNNGIPNLLEYALDGDPASDQTGTGILPQAGLTSSGHLQLSFIRPPLRSDLTLTVQASESLEGPWLDLARSAGGAPFSVLMRGTTVTEQLLEQSMAVTVVDSVKQSSIRPRRFMRLKASY